MTSGRYTKKWTKRLLALRRQLQRDFPDMPNAALTKFEKETLKHAKVTDRSETVISWQERFPWPVICYNA